MLASCRLRRGYVSTSFTTYTNVRCTGDGWSIEEPRSEADHVVKFVAAMDLIVSTPNYPLYA